MKPYMKILVAYDGSTIADKALNEAIILAEKFKGTIILIQVVWGKPDAEIRSKLKPVEEKIMKSGIKSKTRIECSEYPPRTIIRVAKDEACDLITIGSRGLGDAKAWVMGSVSRRVIEEALCPVLIVK